MLKTVGKYETENKVFVFKVKQKKNLAWVNIFDTSDNYIEEFSLVPVNENLEAYEDYPAKPKNHDECSVDVEYSQGSQVSHSYLEPADDGTLQTSPAKAGEKTLEMCDMCGKQVSNLSQHRKHHNKEKITCKVCNRPVRKIVSHRHVCNLKLYGCSCGVSFALRSEIEAHVRTFGQMEGNHNYQCCRCSALMAAVDDFEKHLSSKHKILICLTCYKNFPNEEMLRMHRNRHAAQKAIICSICSIELSSKESLIHHTKCIHLAENNTTCSLCCITFSTKDHLKRHMEVIHENHMGFTCKVCGKSFAHGIALNRHMVTHGDQKPFQCAFCPASFKLPRELRKHNSAHQEFMIRCPSCESFHLNQQELNLHLKRHPSHRRFTGIAGNA